MTVSQQTITIEGRQARFWSGGSGTPLILLHGELGDARQQWHTCFKALTPHFQVIAPDLPGFGVSAPLYMPSYQNYLNWLQLLLDMLNIGGPLLLMGNSFGAVLCRFFAAENTGYVARLVLIAGGAIIDRAGCLRPLYRLPISSSLIFGAMHRRAYSVAGLKRVIYNTQLITPEFAANVQAAWPGYVTTLQQAATSSSPTLRTPTCPTLVIWGEHDQLISPAAGRQMAAEINGAKFKLISQAAHLPQIERPDEFQKLVLPFLRG